MSARVWSPAQQAVFDAVEDDTRKHLVIEALAGSGKTTTIVEALYHTRESDKIAMMAFNVSIRDELARRVPKGVEVMTLHGFGLKAITRAFGRREVDGHCTSELIKEVMGNEWGTREARTAVAKLVSIAKGTLTWLPSELDALADAYGIDIPRDWERSRIVQVASGILRTQCEAEAGPIDFDDMIWLPVVRDLATPTYDWVFVDETQDLNAAQLELVVRAAGKVGRIVAVGDRRQAIYGFRGADKAAIPNMIDRLGAEVLPLSTTYRCPTAVVGEAKRLVSQIEPAPNAPTGVVRAATFTDLQRDARPGDFVVSRTNAPLITLCYSWIANGTKAQIKGRDIGQGLIAWIKGTRAKSVSQLWECIRSWKRSEMDRLLKAERDTQAVEDKASCLEALTTGCESVEDVIAKVGRLFGDASGGEGAIVLSSTHRAKGLEADRVWLLRDTYMRWPGDEESNLLYVAITRSKSELIYVYESEEAARAGEVAA